MSFEEIKPKHPKTSKASERSGTDRRVGGGGGARNQPMGAENSGLGEGLGLGLGEGLGEGASCVHERKNENKTITVSSIRP